MTQHIEISETDEALRGITLEGKTIFEHLGQPKYHMFQPVAVGDLYGGYISGISVRYWDVLYLPTKQSPNRAYGKEGELLKSPQWSYEVRSWDGTLYAAEALDYELKAL